MPLIRSLVFKRRTYTVAMIFLLSEIMPSYSCCEEKKLVYIIIIALSNYQPSFCIKYTKLNIHSSCNIKLVSDAEYL